MNDDVTGQQARALHVFDMDGTLLAGSACLDLSARAGYLSSVEEMEEAWSRGEIGHVEFYDLLIPLWSELTAEDVDETFEKAVWIQGLREVLADIRLRGERSAVVSLSPHFFVQRLREWGLDYPFGAGVEIGEPVVADKVFVPETKVSVVEDLLAALGLEEDRCVVYGDSSSDVPLFQRFTNNVAVNASASLLPFAHVTYEGLDLQGAYALGRSLLGDRAEGPMHP
ncbi:MAG: HAD-IB family phosphatase [Actinobacteria bacterium]|nr:HAD-IB family phosphatase [Actinomycetota bacterium]